MHSAHPSSHSVIVLTRCLHCWRLGVALGGKTRELAEYWKVKVKNKEIKIGEKLFSCGVGCKYQQAKKGQQNNKTEIQTKCHVVVGCKF